MLAIKEGRRTMDNTKNDMMKATSVEIEAGGYADDSKILNMADTKEEIRAVGLGVREADAGVL